MLNDNLADYADPIIYDQENKMFESDGPFFLEMAQQAAGPVLDLGCGSDRIAIPLAEHDINITGLEIVPGMLVQAKHKAEDLPIHWVEADVRVSGTEYYDPLRQVKVETAVRRWTDKDGNKIARKAPLSLRYIYPQEMEALLHYNGFTTLNVYGDWDRTPLTTESQMMIYVCEKEKVG